MTIQNYSMKRNNNKHKECTIILFPLLIIVLLINPTIIISWKYSNNVIVTRFNNNHRRIVSSNNKQNNIHNIILSLSGGSSQPKQNSNSISSSSYKNNKVVNSNKSKVLTKNISIGIILSSITITLYLTNKQHIHTFLSYYSKLFKDWLQYTLLQINRMGNYGLVIYTMTFAIWEFLGQTTCPVETAAGMAFGVKRGLIASSIGRFLGAILAFIIGRYTICYKILQNKLLLTSSNNNDNNDDISNNKIISMANKSMKLHPYRTCLVIRYSCFPEIIKNFGLSILDHITPFRYASTMLIHAVPFTTLWTLVGHEAALKLAFDDGNIKVYQPNKILPWFVLGVPIFGIVGSPAIVVSNYIFIFTFF